jgi:hypothetical protein
MTALSFGGATQPTTISRRDHLPHFGNTGSGRARVSLQETLVWQAQNESCCYSGAVTAYAARNLNPGLRQGVFANCAIGMKERACRDRD